MTSQQPTDPRRVTLVLLAGASAQLGWIVARLEPEHERASLGRGEWNPRQLLAHLVMYEERYLLPTLQLICAGEDATNLEVTGTESDLRRPSPELAELSAQQVHARLLELEAQRTALVEAMSEAEFLTPRPTIWGWQTPRWVLEKSFGHYLEHGVTVFYISHFYALAQRLPPARSE